MEVKRKEEYEIDPNSSFNKLRKLQMTLKEEVALTDIFFENRDELLKKIEENCHQYYKRRISIQGIYDHTSQDKSKRTTKINYVVSPNAPNELPQCFDPLNKLMFYLHDSNQLTLKLIEFCPKESFEQLANFICNFYYVNIFSSTFLNENLLTLIYLLLEKEIDSLNDEKTAVYSFLDSSKSFAAVLLKCLSRRDEVKSYLENILKTILIKTAGLLGNQKNTTFNGLDIHKIKGLLTKNKYSLPKTMKMTDSFSYLLTSDIKKCRLNIMKEFANKKKNNSNNDDNTQLSKEEIENNFYVQATKETFDDLILGNDDDDDDLIHLNDDEEEKSQKKNLIMGNFVHRKKKGGEDDIENFLVKSGYYSSNKKDKDEKNDEQKKQEELFIQKNRDKIFNDLYLKELNTETLLNELDKQCDDDMEDYIMNKINNLQHEKNCSYTNTVFINEILALSGTKTFLEKLILIYKYNFECIRSFVDELFTSLVKNKENTPYIIRAICTIISKLIIIKYPHITNIQIISFISEFLFSNLIIPILFKPTFNGIMMYDFEKRKEATNRYTKIVAITKILK